MRRPILCYSGKVHFPLKSAFQFASLTRKRQMLSREKLPVVPLIQDVLLPRVLDFELSELRWRSYSSDPQQPSRDRVKRMFSMLLKLGKPLVDLDVNDLEHIHGSLLSPADNLYREAPTSQLAPAHQPLDPVMIQRAMERFFEWVRSPSFGEMHAVEQATVSQLRLNEIHPFARYSGLTSSAFSYYFPLAAGYLLPLYQIDGLPEYQEALSQAFAFSTQELVRLNAEACERAYDCALEES